MQSRITILVCTIFIWEEDWLTVVYGVASHFGSHLSTTAKTLRANGCCFQNQNQVCIVFQFVKKTHNYGKVMVDALPQTTCTFPTVITFCC